MNEQDLYNQLNPIYDPQRASIETQRAAIAGQTASAKSALEQARVNAFRDITNTASARGGFFSGYAPSEQAKYTGATYIPGIAGIEQAGLNANTSLTDALNKINADQKTTAMSRYDSQHQKVPEPPTPKAPTTNEIRTLASQDLQQLFNGYDPKNASHKKYTEDVVIPKLIELYPELTAQNIYDMVYPYRKFKFGE